MAIFSSSSSSSKKTDATTGGRYRSSAVSRARSILNLSSPREEEEEDQEEEDKEEEAKNGETLLLTKASIDRAFRRHSLRAHPDKKDGSEELFARGKWAKEVLMRHVNGESVEDDEDEDERESLLRRRKPTYDWKRTRAKKKEEGRRESDGSDRLKEKIDRRERDAKELKVKDESRIKLKTLHRAHVRAVTAMSVLKRDGCVFIASGDAGGAVIIYERKSEREVSVTDHIGVKYNLGAIAALEWSSDENNETRGQTISLAVTFAKECEARVYEFLPLDLSVKSKTVLRGTHSKRITCCAFRGDVLVLGSADGTSSVWTKERRNTSIQEWTRKRMLRHHSDKETEATPSSAVTSTLIHFSESDGEENLHIVTTDASGRFKVWKGVSNHLEKLAKIHDVNWSGCGGIVKAALMRKCKSRKASSADEKVFLVTSHFDSNSDISRALCWKAFVQNDETPKTPIRGYVHEYPKKDVPFYGRLSSFDFFTPLPNDKDKRGESIAKTIDSNSEDDDVDDSTASSSSLGAFVAASTLAVVDTAANALLFSLDLPSASKQTKISPNGLYVACALTTGQIVIVSIDDAEILLEVNDFDIITSTSSSSSSSSFDASPPPPPPLPPRPRAASSRANAAATNTTTLWTLEWLEDSQSLIYGSCDCAIREVRFV